MSTHGLEVLETSTQKTHEWIAQVAAATHTEKGDAYKALRAVLQTTRDRLPVNDAVHFAAQLPMLLRGLYFEGWAPASVPIKFSRDGFLQEVRNKIVTDHAVDPLRITQNVFSVIRSHVGVAETEKIKHCFPKDMQTLWPDQSVTL
jgi:uncharacterized protein (DUF2267 family)